MDHSKHVTCDGTNPGGILEIKHPNEKMDMIRMPDTSEKTNKQLSIRLNFCSVIEGYGLPPIVEVNQCMYMQ